MDPHPTFATRARAWLARLTGSGRGAPRCDPALLRQAIEQVVDGVDPRLRAQPGYARRLAPAVEHTVGYFIECGEWLAAPVEFSARAWATDPLVRALFATVADLHRFFGHDQGLRNFFHDHPLADAAYVGLGVTRQTRQRFGVAMSGEVVQREVPQTVLGFVDYRLFGACGSEAELRRHIEQRGFGFLIGEALERIVEQHTGGDGDRHEQQMLELRLRALLQKRRAVDALYYESQAALDDEIAELRTRLMHAEEARAARRPGGARLDAYIATIAAVLTEAERHVRRETVRLRVDRMNVLVESPDQPADELVLSEVTIGSRPPRLVVLVRYPRAELRDERMRLDAAQDSLRR
jgi:hypothetical protein